MGNEYSLFVRVIEFQNKGFEWVLASNRVISSTQVISSI